MCEGLEDARSAAEKVRPDLPTQFVCPITGEVMEDPVSTVDGHTYERAAISRWLTMNRTSPMTGTPLPSADLVPAIALRQLIESTVSRDATAARDATR